jgi:FkbM family methyltransferase
MGPAKRIGDKLKAVARAAGASSAGRALLSLGAKAQPAAAIRLGGQPPVIAAIDPEGLPKCALLAFTLDIAPRAETIVVQLRAQDGSVIDQAIVGANYTSLALFTPPMRVSVIARTLDERPARIDARKPALYALSDDALTPQPLSIVGDLSIPFDWRDAYSDPDPADVRARLRKQVFKRLSAPCAIPTVGGLEVWLEPGDELSQAVFVTGFYEPESMAAIRSLLPKDGVFVDVGAHCGMFTLLGASCVGPKGRVIAFEPSAREHVRLCANIALNALTNITACQTAAADRNGTAVLRLAQAGHAGHSTLCDRFAYPAVRVVATPTVITQTLDQALAEAAVTRCDVIKMDIQGFELKALMGATQTLAKFRPALVIALSDRALATADCASQELVEWLDRHGYGLRDIEPTTGRILPKWTDGPNMSKNIVALPIRGANPNP